MINRFKSSQATFTFQSAGKRIRHQSHPSTPTRCRQYELTSLNHDLLLIWVSKQAPVMSGKIRAKRKAETFNTWKQRDVEMSEPENRRYLTAWDVWRKQPPPVKSPLTLAITATASLQHTASPIAPPLFITTSACSSFHPCKAQYFPMQFNLSCRHAGSHSVTPPQCQNNYSSWKTRFKKWRGFAIHSSSSRPLVFH